MTYFQKIINGQPQSVKDIVFQILHFLPDNDLEKIYNTHYILHPMLNIIPRTPFCYTNRHSLEFSFNQNNDIFLKIQEFPDEDIEIYADAASQGMDITSSYLLSYDNPRLWYLMRSSIFSYVNFNTGRIFHGVHLTADGVYNVKATTYSAIVSIVTKIRRPIMCYRTSYNERYIYSDYFKEIVEKCFVHVPIPLSVTH